MSAFLGPIHYWMYNKIKWHEELLENILSLSEAKRFDSEELRKDLTSKFGEPVKGDLADVITHDNIHGWLQEQVSSVESRIAMTVTKLLNYKIVSLEDLIKLYYDFGKETFEKASLEEVTSKGIFNALNNYLLEGMPCDGINKIIPSNNNDYAWIRTKCIHSQYWDMVNGNINIFYQLRDSLINGFVETAGKNFAFDTSDDGVNLIKEV